MTLLSSRSALGQINIKAYHRQPLSVCFQMTVRERAAPGTIEANGVVVTGRVVGRSTLTGGDLQCFEA
jgi:hypothetical protein